MEELNQFEEGRFSSKALEDFRLIDQAVQQNDEQAYARLMQRYKRPVYHMILKMVRNVDDAEDLTIESFAKAFKSLHKFKKILPSLPGCFASPPTTPLTLFAGRN